MKLFVTGATGVLGRKTIDLLLKQEHEIHALVRSKSKAKNLNELGVNTVNGDIYDKEFMIESTKGCDGFLQLATAIPKKFNTKAKDWKENNKLQIDGVKNLAKVIKRNKISFYIQNSCLLAYGHRNSKWLDESVRIVHPPKTYYDLDDDYVDILDATVRGEYVLNHQYDGQIPRIILRFGFMYGPESYFTQELIEQVQKNVFPIIEGGKGFINIIHLDDAASAIVQAVEQHEKIIGRTFNVSDDLPVSVNELISYLALKLGAKKPKDVNPKIGNMLLSEFTANLLLSSFKSKNEKFKRMAEWKPRYPTYKEGFDSFIDQFV